MNPSHPPDTTAVFLIVRASPITVASTSLPVAAPRTTSSSFMTWAGLKKCVPITSAGRRVVRASALRSRVDVLLARIAPAFMVSKRLEHRLLHRHVLEHRLHHDVGGGDVRVDQG